ncbi:unnamed protein product [Menidia menidia]|uniref:(Atlantic silverside) hypothetical protein n=1 Tax=Menidia menidia TaxID=238744 RepID=A0A8S4AJL7_9TELE|nr:unnamed protein product [Menidia menidia]
MSPSGGDQNYNCDLKRPAMVKFHPNGSSGPWSACRQSCTQTEERQAEGGVEPQQELDYLNLKVMLLFWFISDLWPSQPVPPARCSSGSIGPPPLPIRVREPLTGGEQRGLSAMRRHHLSSYKKSVARRIGLTVGRPVCVREKASQKG